MNYLENMPRVNFQNDSATDYAALLTDDQIDLVSGGEPVTLSVIAIAAIAGLAAGWIGVEVAHHHV